MQLEMRVYLWANQVICFRFTVIVHPYKRKIEKYRIQRYVFILNTLMKEPRD
jgi:hypothetical protein